MPLRIIVIEDDRLQRDELYASLSKRGHRVRTFRDLATFKKACDDAKQTKVDLFGDSTEVFPGTASDADKTVAILDVMLARELDDKAECAKRWERPGFPPDSEPEYVDDELGVSIATEIREGLYKPAVPKSIPILFLTARQNDDLRELMEEIGKVLGKPAFVETIEAALFELVGQAPILAG